MINTKDYGGRGHQVCAKWRKSFQTFLKDMGKRPGKVRPWIGVIRMGLTVLKTADGKAQSSQARTAETHHVSLRPRRLQSEPRHRRDKLQSVTFDGTPVLVPYLSATLPTPTLPCPTLPVPCLYPVFRA